LSGSRCATDASFTRRLPPRPSSVSEARALVRELLADAEREDLSEAALLLVSEVVTNALLHAGTPIDVSASIDDGGLRVEVGDGSVHLPVRRQYAATSGTGRGIRLLEEMGDDWGITRRPRGKAVWFRLSGRQQRQQPTADPARRTDTRDAAAEDVVVVQLLDLPLLLHGAWQEHAEALLRDYLLYCLDEAGTDNPIQVHAEATDAIAIVEELVPTVDVTVEPDRLMADATEPRVSVARLELRVPLGSVRHFETLDRAIDAAIDLSRSGRILTPVTQPEIRAFRQWLCSEVVEQAAGAAPTPWSFREDEEAAPPRPQAWGIDLSASTGVGRIAADDENRIVAVNAHALRLLGYDDAAELVGRRIVALIPERYRQAHVAGFTMFMLVGRRPLLGHPVVVPALRRDGSEVAVELYVDAVPRRDGTTSFVADLRPAAG
jgi:PAS domain S-box-containing protein